jgi:hypothetical protein
VITPFKGDFLPRFVFEQLTGVQRKLKATLTIQVISHIGKSNEIDHLPWLCTTFIEIPSKFPSDFNIEAGTAMAQALPIATACAVAVC